MNTYQLTHIRSGCMYQVDAIDLCDVHRKATYIFSEEEEFDFSIKTIVKIPEPLYPVRRKKSKRTKRVK